MNKIRWTFKDDVLTVPTGLYDPDYAYVLNAICRHNLTKARFTRDKATGEIFLVRDNKEELTKNDAKDILEIIVFKLIPRYLEHVFDLVDKLLGKKEDIFYDVYPDVNWLFNVDEVEAEHISTAWFVRIRKTGKFNISCKTLKELKDWFENGFKGGIEPGHKPNQIELEAASSIRNEMEPVKQTILDGRYAGWEDESLIDVHGLEETVKRKAEELAGLSEFTDRMLEEYVRMVRC